MPLPHVHTHLRLHPSPTDSRKIPLRWPLEEECRGALRGLGWVMMFYVMLMILAALAYWLTTFLR
jgi:hypothetical protein